MNILKRTDADERFNIIFFDGFCVLCNHFAKWVIAKDPQKKFKFSTLDSERAQQMFKDFPETVGIDSVILLKDGKVYMRGAAVREIIHDLSRFTIFKYSLALTPDFMLGFGYDLVAKSRYKIFGKYDVCPLPSNEERNRFV